MKLIAILQRFEEDKGVMLVGDDQEEWIISKRKLPPDIRVGDILNIEIGVNIYAGFFQTKSFKPEFNDIDDL